MLIDGIVLGDHSVVVALGIDAEGKKQVLGLREDHTEHSHVVKALLRDLVERGLDQEHGRDSSWSTARRRSPRPSTQAS